MLACKEKNVGRKGGLQCMVGDDKWKKNEAPLNPYLIMTMFEA
jgi:hypothetical protein